MTQAHFSQRAMSELASVEGFDAEKLRGVWVVEHVGVPEVLGAGVQRRDGSLPAVVRVAGPLVVDRVADGGWLGAWPGLGFVHELLAAFVWAPGLVDVVAGRSLAHVSPPRRCRRC